MRMRTSPAVLLSACLLALLVAACAPTSQAPRTSVQEASRPAGFYPSQTGARWEYLPNNAPVSASPTVSTVEGPRVVGDDVLIAWRVIGGGLDHSHFRSYAADGVRLHARTYPGASMSFDPPLLEYPAQAQLVRGASWGGSSTVSVSQPGAPPEHRRTSYEVSYRYTVVDRRRVRVEAGEFDVYVINLVTRETTGADTTVLTQEIWFSPYAGEIRNVSGEYLTSLNFTPTLPQ